MSNTISDRIFKDTSEKKMLNKFDILYVLFIVFLSFFLIFFGIFFVKKTGNRAIVKYNNKEIMDFGGIESWYQRERRLLVLSLIIA